MFNNKFIKNIKENLSLILLLPPILGGFWQLLELSKISISFIRFFSPSQLLPDGLLILFIFIMFYVSYKVATFKKYKYNFNDKILDISIKKPSNFNNYFIYKKKLTKLKYIDNPIYRINLIPFDIIVVFIGILLTYLMINLLQKDTEFHIFNFILIFGALLMISRLIIESFSILCIQLFKLELFKPLKNLVKKNNDIAKLAIAFSLSILFFIIVYIFSFFHNMFFLSDDLKNLEYINNSLNSKNYLINKILYFNDKYIFIKHQNNENNITIEILKFEDLFEKDDKTE